MEWDVPGAAVSCPIPPVESLWPACAPAHPRAEWIAPGRTVVVQNRRISAGMFYLGTELPALPAVHRSQDSSLIDPGLSTAEADAFPGRPLWLLGGGMPYAALPPEQRGDYLDWLAAGRPAGPAATHCLGLFFSGLERRALGDLVPPEDHRDELRALAAEAARLLAAWGPFDWLAPEWEELAALLQVLAAADVAELTAPLAPSFGHSPQLSVGLGALVGAGQPLPWRWALAWLYASSNALMGTVLDRCADEFHALFRQRYEAQFGAGVVVKPPQTRLQVYYAPQDWQADICCYAWPALPNLALALSLDLPRRVVMYQRGFEEIPIRAPRSDVSRLQTAIAQIHDTALGCLADLQPYSRFIGRCPEQRHSIAALSRLPGPLLADHPAPELSRWLRSVDALLGAADAAELELSALLALWPTAQPDAISRGEQTALAQMLGHGGYGLEPDPTFGGPTLKPGDTAVLFRLTRGRPDRLSSALQQRALLYRLALSVAAVDGELTAPERDWLAQLVRLEPQLSTDDAARLRAQTAWFARRRITPAAVRAALALLSPAECAAYGRRLAELAAGDGPVTPAEVDELRRVYKLLQLEPQTVHQDLHALATGAPVQDSAPTELALDHAKVRRVEQESAAAGVLLAELLADAEPEPVAPAVAGLDAAHSGLLQALAQREELPREEFAALAAQWRLLPHGALDTLNDAALELADEPVLEGDDPVLLNRVVLQQMLAG